MTCLSEDECATWCKARGLDRDGKSLLYLNSEPLNGELPDASREQAHFARFATELNLNFHGCLVWLTAWGISPSEENPSVVVKIREAFGEQRSLREAPGHLFSDVEADLATGLIRLVLAFAWDAHVVHVGDNIAMTLSHDGWFEVCGRESETAQRIRRYLKSSKA